ncbi:MAG: carbohydrate-binding protein [Armatimonadota bacterium]
MRALLAATAMMVIASCSTVTHANDARASVVRVEAEDYAGMHGLQVIERAEASGARTVSYWEEPGSWLDLEFELPEAGRYVISMRYALNWPDTRRDVLLGGEELGEVELETTGSWGDFETVTLPFEPVELPAGRVTLRVLNRDSRGLSLDWVALHAPEAPLADRQLSAEECAELRRRVVEAAGPGARRVLDHGEVELHAARAGGPAWANVSGHLLVAGGAPGEDRGAAIMRRSTEYHQITLVGGGAGGDGLLIAITDGTSLHIAALADGGRAIPLPAPVLSADGMRIVTARAAERGALHLPTGEWRVRTDHLEAGGMHITSAPEMTLRPWDERGLAPKLSLEMIECGAGRIGVARFSPRWGSEKPRVALALEDGVCVVRESVIRHPTLAAFYGEGMFDLRIAPDGRITFDDIRSGEAMVLREGR